MTKMHRNHLLFAPLVLGVAFACGDDEDTTPADAGVTDTGSSDTGTAPSNIVETAQAAGLSSLLMAATTAGLAETLAGPGPFTVFAPSNAAFTALGSAAPTDPGLLANVLLHHVVAGTNRSEAVLGAPSHTTLAKTTIAVDAMATPPTIGGAAINTDGIDVEASNGIVHLLDAVMVPPTIPEAVAATDGLSTLLAAVGAASPAVQEALASGPITVFAPVNSAFEGINLAELSQAQVDAILSHHVVMGQVLSTDLAAGPVGTLNGDITVAIDGAAVTLTDGMGNEVSVTETDIRLLNGVVHLIDGVLMPMN